jgi:hypothetical protein
MADLDDGPKPVALPMKVVQDAILAMLPGRDYDLLVTHAPEGEYTRHRRHEEVSRSIRDLWLDGELRVGRLCQFAYEDAGGSYCPRPRREAHLHLPLSDLVGAKKRKIITEIYGFGEDSWQAQVGTQAEAFSYFREQEPRRLRAEYGRMLMV